MGLLRSFIGKKATALTLSLLSLGTLNVKTSYGANNVLFIYSPFIASLRVESLEQFAETGTINQNLGFYFNLAKVSPEQKEEFRRVLTTPVIVDPALLSRILNTDEGNRLLNYFGSVINIRGGRNGKFVLRGALIKASMEKEGLSLLNVIRNLAVDVQINIAQILDYVEQVELVVRGTEFFVNELSRLSAEEIKKSEAVDFSKLNDIRLPGPLAVTNTTINLFDAKRQRKLYMLIYQPVELTRENTPVIILSHGLSSRPEDFAARARHLASYGFVVALPQHPGSDIRQTEDFINGFSRQIFRLEEFIDRPLDITFVLDELTKMNPSKFGGKLDLKRVGIIGHSFGGYNALALGGAVIDFDTLERNCRLAIGNLNVSLLLQCRALQLPQKEYNFRDSRIASILVINPVNASIFNIEGLNKIDVPLFVAAGSYDPATPFVFEQARTFSNLTNPNLYLQLQEGQAHVDFSQLDAGVSDLVQNVANLTLPAPFLLDSYTDSMTLAFFQVHLNNNPDYKVFLQSSFANYISQGQEFKTFLITSKSIPELGREFNQFILDNYNVIFR